MKKSKTLAALLLLMMISCRKDDDKPKGEFSSGVFVVNEGNFGSSNGEISFYMPSSGNVQQAIFGAANSGRSLGDVVQSMTVNGNSAYLVVNNSNKLEIVDANTFVSQHSVSGLSLPRFFTVANGKGYLTEWVNFTDPGRISVINLTTMAIETTIGSDYGPENIVAANNELFVSNNFSTTVFVIDPGQNKVIDTVEVGSSPGALVIDKDSKLWVISGGGYASDYSPLNNGTLSRINTTTHAVEQTINLGQNVPAKMAINKAKDKLYFFDNTHIYAAGVGDTSAPSSAFISEALAVGFYGIGVDPSTDIVYAADAIGFTGSGTVFRYTAEGTKIDNFTSGIGPNGFVFK